MPHLIGSAASRRPIGYGAPGAPAAIAVQRVTVTLTLSGAPRESVQANATAVSTPGNRDFRRTLTLDELRARFGARADRVERVSSVARRAGFAAGELAAAGTRLTPSGLGTPGRTFLTDIVS